VVSLKKYNLDGNKVGDVAIDDAFLDVDANRQMIKDYIVALRANARQWSANTKGRSEVKHTTKKPYRQKRTGNARQGMLITPQYRGGGIVFGPKPKFDQHVRINRKERRLATRHLLAEKIKEEGIIVVEDQVFGGALDSPKTKKVSSFLEKLSINGKRILFVGEGAFEEGKSASSDRHEIFKKSMRNLSRWAFAIASNVNGYDVIAAQRIIITESALSELQELLK